MNCQGFTTHWTRELYWRGNEKCSESGCELKFRHSHEKPCGRPAKQIITVLGKPRLACNIHAKHPSDRWDWEELPLAEMPNDWLLDVVGIEGRHQERIERQRIEDNHHHLKHIKESKKRQEAALKELNKR